MFATIYLRTPCLLVWSCSRREACIVTAINSFQGVSFCLVRKTRASAGLLAAYLVRTLLSELFRALVISMFPSVLSAVKYPPGHGIVCCAHGAHAAVLNEFGVCRFSKKRSLVTPCVSCFCLRSPMCWCLRVLKHVLVTLCASYFVCRPDVV